LRWAASPASAASADAHEKPHGDWNTLECICRGHSINVILNGTQVSSATRASQTKGKLLILSEGAEIFIKRIDLNPL